MMSHILKSVTMRQELKSLGMRGYHDLIWTASWSTFPETVSSLEHFKQCNNMHFIVLYSGQFHM